MKKLFIITIFLGLTLNISGCNNSGNSNRHLMPNPKAAKEKADKNYNEKMNSLQNNINRKNLIIDNYEEINKDLKEEHDELSDNYEKIKKDLDKESKEKNDIKNENKNLKEENEKLSKELEDLKNSLNKPSETNIDDENLENSQIQNENLLN